MNPYLLDKTVYVASVTGIDASGAGDPVYGTPVARAARVDIGNKLVTDADGAEVQATHTIYLSTPVALSDLMWLPGDDKTEQNEARQPIAMSDLANPSGAIRVVTVHL